MAAASHWSNQLVVRRQELGGAVCLILTGELDLASVATLQAHFKAIAQSEDHVIVDLSGLRYIDSTGAKTLLDAPAVVADGTADRAGRRSADGATNHRRDGHRKGDSDLPDGRSGPRV